MKCPRCNGDGVVIIYSGYYCLVRQTCHLCEGSCEVDWLSEIFDKKQKYLLYDNIRNFEIKAKQLREEYFEKRRLVYTFFSDDICCMDDGWEGTEEGYGKEGYIKY